MYDEYLSNFFPKLVDNDELTEETDAIQCLFTKRRKLSTKQIAQTKSYMFLNLKLDDSLDFHLFLWYLVCYLKKGTTK